MIIIILEGADRISANKYFKQRSYTSITLISEYLRVNTYNKNEKKTIEKKLRFWTIRCQKPAKTS